MLVLSRKLNQSIVINGDIRITVVSIRGNQVRIGIEAPDRWRIFREELCEPTALYHKNNPPARMPPDAGQRTVCLALHRTKSPDVRTATRETIRHTFNAFNLECQPCCAAS